MINVLRLIEIILGLVFILFLFLECYYIVYKKQINKCFKLNKSTKMIPLNSIFKVCVLVIFTISIIIASSIITANIYERKEIASDNNCYVAKGNNKFDETNYYVLYKNDLVVNYTKIQEETDDYLLTIYNSQNIENNFSDYFIFIELKNTPEITNKEENINTSFECKTSNEENVSGSFFYSNYPSMIFINGKNKDDLIFNICIDNIEIKFNVSGR